MKEALKLALEFLEDNQHYVADNERHVYVMLYNEVIEKCKAALAQQDGQSNFCTQCEAFARELKAVKQALAAQPAQEPVAWADIQKEAQQIVESKFLWKKFIDGTPLSNDIACWMADFAQQYTTPQQRPWVGLTDAEIECIEETTTCSGNESWLRNLTRAIEAKLKEKNSG